MINTCNIQKNVNMTIKDGLKKIIELVSSIDRDHKVARVTEDWY